MAIATLDKLYGNPNVFTGVVKIRKGLSCKLILHTNSMEEVHEIFYNFAVSVKGKALAARKKGVSDPNFDRTLRVCDTIMALTSSMAAARSWAQTKKWLTVGGCLGAALWTRQSTSSRVVKSEWKSILQAGLVMVGAGLYWWGPWNAKSKLRPAKEIALKSSERLHI